MPSRPSGPTQVEARARPTLEAVARAGGLRLLAWHLNRGEGEDTAREALKTHFPGIHGNTVNALTRLAYQSIAAADNYRGLGPSEFPRWSEVPRVSGSEAPVTYGVTLEWIDPASGRRHWLTHEIAATGLMTPNAVRAAALREAMELYGADYGLAASGPAGQVPIFAVHFDYAFRR